MKRKTFSITRTRGLSNRAAAGFVYVANASKSAVWIEKDGERRDGKSIVDFLSLAAPHGSVVTVTVEGEDEEATMRRIIDLIEAELSRR